MIEKLIKRVGSKKQTLTYQEIYILAPCFECWRKAGFSCVKLKGSGAPKMPHKSRVKAAFGGDAISHTTAPVSTLA